MIEGGPRWGASAVFRHEGEVVERLTAPAAAVPATGHRLHGGSDLHLTFRTLEPYRLHIPVGDPLRRAYGEALTEAVEGLPPARMRLKGLSPHPGGVVVHGHPQDDTADAVRKRFAHALQTRGVRDYERGRVRDRRHVSLVHFAGPLGNPKELVAWCDAHAAADLGTTELVTAEIVQYLLTGTGIRPRSLESARLTR
ncbi:hypothetical protein ACIBP6_39100 [Nonomuraea terrae]|uniref:hypothetical protein n=1 Tax=Nonomuraea terrae TaxID=2530383 RepID=UPI0037959342